ncbi:sugar ABC transporter substrate-binding protein [Herbiconiux flava]|uniref:Multiple sugar transport system substrate-binding protein n=1 Tax=Herbiconiux flava TaxID=881268 RepID=A0A852SUL1_9MICO|nr:ABC transporter substrate-binding protein [Herbiconiux flava]NYD72270.1 multiple sugar transport system substrate-binding protein [Herbiconiux flava]GLK17767.1 ABC transporter substrate-binding protein [Herbiconiux flava]
MQRRSSLAVALGLAAATALTLSACGSGFDDAGETGAAQDDSAGLTVLIGSSGDAETQAVTDAVAAWSEESGTEATLNTASDLNQQLSQGFASGKPADVFYVSTDALAGYAANGSLHPYGDQLSNKDDFYPTLVDSFTYDGQFYCAPKDFSTLALIINTDLWTAAGLTDADVPTTWDQLTAVAQKLTTPEHVGLAFSPEYARVGAFMAEAGGSLLNEDGTEATVNSPENVEALEYVKSLFSAGVAKYSSDLGAGWGGEAFGKGQAAMTIEGNWIAGGLQADYPDVKYTVAALPAGPGGEGTLQFSNCWGIAADSPNQEAALALVEKLTSTDQQLEFAKAFGVMPSVQSAAEQWKTENPDKAAFLDSADYAQGVPTLEGSADVIKDLNSQLESLSTGDPAAILETAQKNMEAIVQ